MKTNDSVYNDFRTLQRKAGVNLNNVKLYMHTQKVRHLCAV